MAVMRFWLNAFIPKVVAGYTIAVTKGPHTGKTAIPQPAPAYGWPGNWSWGTGTVAWSDVGFLTDQRGFDNTYLASARMTSMVEVEMDTLSIVRQDHTTAGTTKVSLSTGAQTGFAKAKMDRCKFATTSSSSSQLELWLRAAEADPLVALAADIDYAGTVIFYNNGGISIDFAGLIDGFPAYDCYASYNGVTKTIFTNNPPKGNTVMNLLGGPNRAVAGSAVF